MSLYPLYKSCGLEQAEGVYVPINGDSSQPHCFPRN